MIVNAAETNGRINSMRKSFDLMFRVKFFLKMTLAYETTLTIIIFF